MKNSKAYVLCVTQFFHDKHVSPNEPTQTIFDKINKKYGAKVVPQIGYCIGAYAITEIGDGKLPPGDGASHFEVHATLLVWRPIDGEVIEGVICACTKRGIKVSLQFFDDIWIEPKNMFQGATFYAGGDENEPYWKWVLVGQDINSEEGYYFDVGNKIRVKFESCDYYTKPETNMHGEPMTVKKETIRATKKAKKVTFQNDKTGMGAENIEAVPQTRSRSYSTEDLTIKDEPKEEDKVPMLVSCSCNQSGLGDPSWWL